MQRRTSEKERGKVGDGTFREEKKKKCVFYYSFKNITELLYENETLLDNENSLIGF